MNEKTNKILFLVGMVVMFVVCCYITYLYGYQIGHTTTCIIPLIA